MTLLRIKKFLFKKAKNALIPAFFLWVLMFSLGIGRIANDTFFIRESGAINLPFAIIFNALVIIVASLLYIFLERRLQRFSFLTGLISFFAITLFFLRSQFFQNYTWLPYAIFAYYEMIFLFVQMHFWTCLNDVFGPREGKKLFPYLSAIGLVGTICGGLFTWLSSFWFEYHQLFYVWISLLLLTIPISTRLGRSKNAIAVKRVLKGKKESTKQNIQEIWKSPLIRYLALISVPLWLVIHSVDWLFFLYAEEMFTDNPKDLSAFLGILNGSASLVGALLQFFVTPFILRNFGVGFTYSLHSIIVTFGALLFTIRSFIPVASNILSPIRTIFPIIARFIDETIHYSAYETTTHLLFGAIPSKIRGQSRIFIHGLFDTTVTVLSGFILLVASILTIPHRFIALTAFCIGFLWIFLAFRIKKYYINELALTLSSNTDRSQTNLLSNLQVDSKITKATKKLLLASIYGDNDEAALFSLSYIKKVYNREILLEMSKNITQMKGIAFKGSLHLFSEAKIKEILPILKAIYTSSPEERQSDIIECIGKLEPSFIFANIGYFRQKASPPVLASAILTLFRTHKSGEGNRIANVCLKEMVNSKAIPKKVEAIHILSQLKTKSIAPLFLKLARDTNHKIKIETIKVIGYIKNQKITNFLIQELKKNKNTPIIISALIQQGVYCLGPLQKLAHTLKINIKKHHNLLKNIIKCIGDIQSMKSISLLSSLLEKKEQSLERHIIPAMENILYINYSRSNQKNIRDLFSKHVASQVLEIFHKNSQNIYKINMYLKSLQCIEEAKIKGILCDGLNQTYNFCLETMLKCMSILYNPVKIRVVIRGLHSNEKRMHSEALEVLESIGYEGEILSKIVEKQKEKKVTVIKEQDQLLEGILKLDNSQWQNMCTIYSIGELKASSLQNTIQKYKTHPDHLVRMSAIVCLDKLSNQKGKKLKEKKRIKEMAINIEKILFLRTVPIFANVSTNDLQWISEIVVEKLFEVNDYVFHEDDFGDTFYIIQRGEVSIQKGDIFLTTLHAKDHFGEIAMYDQQPRTADAICKSKTMLLSIERKNFQRLLLNRPEIAMGMFENFSRRLRDVTKKLN